MQGLYLPGEGLGINTMQRVNPTILGTPLSIYHVVKENFATAEIDVEVGPQQVVMQIRFSQQLPAISITQAVDTRKFQETLQQIKTYLDMVRLFGAGVHPCAVNSHQFSLQQPLSNWQEYRRTLYQNDGRNCTDAIINFLQNPERMNEVTQLGLAPHQVTPDDMPYFRIIPDKLRYRNQEFRQAINTAFGKNYPPFYRQLLSEFVDRDRAVQGGGGDDFYRTTLATLKEQVVGQDQAVEKITAMLATQRTLQSNKVFLLVGPSGVGKTELAKAVSRTRNNRFITIQMQTCQEEHSAATIFGSPPGYVGSTDKPSFAQQLDRYQPILTSTEGSNRAYQISNLVVLFDEFEKAHSRVKQSLLTLFDEGIYEARYSEGSKNVTCRYELRQCIIVNTSNLYKDPVLQAFRSGHSCDQIVEIFKQLNRELPIPESLSQELLGRMSVVPFGPIPRGAVYQQILRLRLMAFCTELQQEFLCKAVDLEQAAAVLLALETKLYGDGTDLRRFCRYFDDIKPLIYQNYQNWGPLATKRLTFACVEGALCIKISTYIEDFLTYYDAGVPPLRLR